MLVSKGCPAGTAEGAGHERRRLKADRSALHEVEARNWERDPSNNRRACGLLAGLAVADHSVCWMTTRVVTNLATETTAFEDMRHVVSRFPRNAVHWIGHPLNEELLARHQALTQLDHVEQEEGVKEQLLPLPSFDPHRKLSSKEMHLDVLRDADADDDQRARQQVDRG